MKILQSPAETRSACRLLRTGDQTLGFVPTMGALHAGHLALVEAARRTCDAVAVSIFVNPTQFGPNEDFSRYPRTLEADAALLQDAGVDLLFAPSAADIYPKGGLGITVDPGPLGERLDGQARPGHFRGVATIVTKLFGIVGPDRTFFGQKDAAQVAVLRAVVRDLDLPVELVTCPTVREPDGLALSSRNRYLSPSERTQALALSKALFDAQRLLAEEGQADPARVTALMRDRVLAAGLRLDYAEAVDPDTLLPVHDLHAPTLLALAAWAGTTRLIDNHLVSLSPVSSGPVPEAA